jgi:hypothetical protein
VPAHVVALADRSLLSENTHADPSHRAIQRDRTPRWCWIARTGNRPRTSPDASGNAACFADVPRITDISNVTRDPGDIRTKNW